MKRIIGTIACIILCITQISHIFEVYNSVDVYLVMVLSAVVSAIFYIPHVFKNASNLDGFLCITSFSISIYIVFS